MQPISLLSSGTDKPLATTQNERVPQKVLGQKDFLKLISVQMTQQDPMKPMEDTAFIAQLAQFTSLEQTGSLVKEFGLMRTGNDFSAASSLIGREVSVSTAKDGDVTGSVTAAEVTNGSPMIYINGKGYPLSSVFRVEQQKPVVQPTA